MIDLVAMQDGDSGAIYRFRLRDNTGIRDLASAAVEMYVYDEDGVSYGMVPGIIASTKASGIIDILLSARMTDFDGLGKGLILRPRIYYATAMDGTPAVNLLLNPSFDAATGSNPARLPDNWALVGARTAVWDNYANDSAPPTIFGTFQLVGHSGLSDPDYIQQAPNVTLVPGDKLSAGCWHRMGQAAQAKNNNHGIFFRPGSEANTVLQFEVTEKNWYFTSGTVVVTANASNATMGIDGRGTTGSNRYDEAFLFKGFWRKLTCEDRRLPIPPRQRLPKSTNQLAGWGSFEVDSNADGVPDGWTGIGSGGTFSLEKTPVNVQHGSASLKAVLTDQSSRSYRIIWRGKAKAGSVWEARVYLKTNGALTAGSGTGGFKIELASQYFVDGVPRQSATTNFGTSLASFTQYVVSLTMNSDKSELVVNLHFNGYSGTAWWDNVELVRTAA